MITTTDKNERQSGWRDCFLRGISINFSYGHSESRKIVLFSMEGIKIIVQQLK